MNKKVLMVGSSLDVKGGMTTVVEGFLSNEFKNFSIYYIPTHIEKSKFMQIIFYAMASIKIIFYLIFKQITIAHIHFSERGSFTRKNLVLKLCKIFNKKTIIHMHGAEFKEFYNDSKSGKKKKILKFLKDADRVIVLGDSWYKFVKELDSEIKVETMPNFVTCVEDKAKFETNEVNIVFLAVLIKRKGIFDLIEAVNLIIKEKKFKDYKLRIIVAGSGKEEEIVKERVNNLGISEYFDFRGWIGKKEKEEILKSGQIFILPSYNEGLPVSILEAMSYGLPIISTNVGSIEDAVIDGYNGSIIEPGDIIGIRNSIVSLIKNKDLWTYYSQNNKDIVIEKYSSHKYFSDLEDMYSFV